jgi:histidyl-tRNA synthetase
MEQAGRSVKGQLKQADRIGAYATVILGDTIEVKDMSSGEQQEASSPTDVPSLLRSVQEREISAT